MRIPALGNYRRVVVVHAESSYFGTTAPSGVRLRRPADCMSRPRPVMLSPCVSVEILALRLRSTSPPAPFHLPTTSAIPIISLVDRDAGAWVLLLVEHLHNPEIVAYAVAEYLSIHLIATDIPGVIFAGAPRDGLVVGLIYAF